MSLPVWDGEEYSHHKCGEQLQQIGIDAEPDDGLQNQVVQDRAERNSQKAQSKIFENTSENRFTDDDSGPMTIAPRSILTSAKP